MERCVFVDAVVRVSLRRRFGLRRILPRQLRCGRVVCLARAESEAMADAGIQILGLGVSTVDELFVLDHHPLPNEKQQIISRSRQCGGLTGSALVAASRLGCRCGYLMTLGVGELSAYLRRELMEQGIRLFENNAEPDTEPYLSMILTERGSGERVILWDNSRSRPPRIGDAERELISSAGCLFVDHVYSEAIVDAVREARRVGVPVVGDFERDAPRSDELMALTDHIILPAEYMRQMLGEGLDPEAGATALARVPGRSLACVTDGVKGAWFALGTAPERVYHQSSFPMSHVVDTTGCGDVFHGVYAAGLVLGWSPAERIRNASAAAALKTLRPGAQAGAPTLDALRRFLHERGQG